MSFIDAFWGAGMGAMALTSYFQADNPGVLAFLLIAMTCTWGFRLGIGKPG